MRLQDGTPAGVDGPFAESDKHVTAYYMFEVADRDPAITIAERLLDSRVTAVEVRHIHDSAGR